MKIKQLGNGGGFDFDKTNSSFLIKSGETTILFDCGFNIMDRLKSDETIDIENIDNVYISHMDEDHVGNLKMFIYWRYFNYKKGCNSEYAEMFNIYASSTQTKHKITDDISILLTNCNHGKVTTFGAIFYSFNKSIFISADTKASKYIEEVSKDCDLIFHDYSNWDFVTRNVHTCRTDFELEYSEEYKNKVVKYHTGLDNFKKDWYEL